MSGLISSQRTISSESHAAKRLEKAILRGDLRIVSALKKELRPEVTAAVVNSAYDKLIDSGRITHDKLNSIAIAMPYGSTSKDRVNAVVSLLDRGNLYKVSVENTAMLERLDEILGRSVRGTAIELGCSYTMDIRALESMGFNPVVGIDFSIAAIGLSRKIMSRMTSGRGTILFVNADILSLPVRAEFNLIYAMHTLEMLGDSDVRSVVDWMIGHTSKSGMNAFSLNGDSHPLPRQVEMSYISSGWEQLLYSRTGYSVSYIFRKP